MSARLIGLMDPGVHSILNDLESSIYVLLWMTLMYSKTSNYQVVPSFLSGVLDPQAHGWNGGGGKAEFLVAQIFLQRVNFPG
jgi:hypothetical protein